MVRCRARWRHRTRELVERPQRRRYSAEYKLRIVQEADACTEPGEVAALLRREGLYTSHLTYWRKQQREGALERLARRRGRKPTDRRDVEIAELRRRLERTGVRAREGAEGDRGAGKSLSALAADGRYRERDRVREHRAMIEQTVQELTPLIGTRPACRALGASPATIYRRRRPPERRPPKPRPASPRALSDQEREAVLAELHCERFVDCAPAQVYATLLDEGRYLCSERTMYRLLDAGGEVRERRDQLTHPAYAKPELLAQGHDLQAFPSLCWRHAGRRGLDPPRASSDWDASTRPVG